MTGFCSTGIASLSLLLAACGSGSDEADGEVIQSNAGGDQVALGMSDDDDAGLGSVNLPWPAWLPTDFPLPEDAHIFITVAKDAQTPRIYMIQARTRANGEDVADAFVAWGKARGLDASRGEPAPDRIHVASLIGRQASDNANLQVLDGEDGVNTMVLAATGEAWK